MKKIALGVFIIGSITTGCFITTSCKKKPNNPSKEVLTSTEVLKEEPDIAYESIDSIPNNSLETTLPPFLNPKSEKWADSVIKTMTLDERLGQLFMVAAYSNKPKEHIEEIKNLVKNYHIGGLIFMQGGPLRQAAQTNLYQSLAKTPLMIAMDAEWGLSMRLDSVPNFPKQMTLGALQNDSLVYAFGKEMALECKRLGVHISFSPDIDVNNNPSNPVINMRSFGDNLQNVTAKGLAYMNGLQDNKVLACGKHFPGHGDTETDSHLDLPKISHSLKRLDSLELYPFRELVKQGLGSIMVAHLSVPKLDNTPNLPTTLSKKVITDLLKTKYNFKGLTFTDALNMKGVAKYYQPGEVDLKALQAGNDVLLFSEDVPKAFTVIKAAIKEGKITEAEINEHCKRILQTKHWMGLSKPQKVNLKNLYEDLNANADKLNRILAKQIITVVKNTDNLVPLKKLDQKNIAIVSLNSDSETELQLICKEYSKTTNFKLKKDASAEEYAALKLKLNNFNTIIIGVHNAKNKMGKSSLFDSHSIGFINSISEKKDVILCVFGNPYSLSNFEGKNIKAILECYEGTTYFENAAAQVIFGGVKAKGKLPVTVGKTFKYGLGLSQNEILRFEYASPEELNLETNYLTKIDGIINKAIAENVFPGGQLLIAQHGKVFYNKSYGHLTYEKKNSVSNQTLYDIASITKIAGSSLALMKAFENNEIDSNTTLGDLLPNLKKTNKGALRVFDVWAHESGLRAWIPFYTSTTINKAPNPKYYSREANLDYNIPVAENLFLRNSYYDSIYNTIDTSALVPKKYRYSDLGYYYFKKYIETKNNTKLDAYLDNNFYNALGLERLTYNPLKKFDKETIAPTEDDNYFRDQLIQGYVHDQGACMLGGVGGHAGLFANSNSLATVFQMLLNGGSYGGDSFLSAKTISYFTNYKAKTSRRALLFDKPELDPKKDGPNSKNTSAKGFGHTGFTGTIAWVNPEKEYVYIFLCNRVYPTAENTKLITQNIRSKIQEEIENMLK